jgi:sortase A
MSGYVVNGPSSFAVRGRASSFNAPGTTPSGKLAAKAGAFSRERWNARRSRRAAFGIATLLAAFALWEFGGAAWIHARATVAQRLIASSWEGTKADGARRPWPWADTRPIARLTVPSRGVSLYVLSGTSGRSLAFGPGHVDGTALPGSSGNSVIVAHRDTHFGFLRQLHEDDEITIEDVRGRVTRYRVRDVAIVDKHETRLLDAADSPQLTLITCWLFDAVQPGTPQRYVVIADRTA